MPTYKPAMPLIKLVGDLSAKSAWLDNKMHSPKQDR